MATSPHRANGRLALHALEVMTAILDGAGRGGAAEIGIQAERPAPFAEDEAAGIVFAEPGGGA
jgi:hypothetical protein